MKALSRRAFLSQSALAGLAAVSAPLFAGEKVRPGFGLGFSLYGMKTLPIADALQTCAEIGYDNVELALLSGFPTEPALLSPSDRAQLREQLTASKLRVSALMDNLTLLADDATRPKLLERIKAAGQLAHDLAPDAPPPLETVLGGKPAEWEQVKERMAEQLRGWAAAAEEAKVVIAIKGHINSAAQTPDRVLWLMHQTASPWIKVAYDFSHFQLQGLALDATLAEMLPHTRFIHVKDGRPKPDGKFEFLLPGEGGTDYGAYFHKLRDLGYRSDVVVEVSRAIWDQPGYDPIAAARKSFAALAPAWKAE